MQHKWNKKKRNKWITAARAMQDIEVSSGRALHSQEVTRSAVQRLLLVVCERTSLFTMWSTQCIPQCIVNSISHGCPPVRDIVHGIASIIQVIDSSTSQGRAKWTSLRQKKRRSRQRAQLWKTQLRKKQTFCQNWPTRVLKYEAAYAKRNESCPWLSTF